MVAVIKTYTAPPTASVFMVTPRSISQPMSTGDKALIKTIMDVAKDLIEPRWRLPYFYEKNGAEMIDLTPEVSPVQIIKITATNKLEELAKTNKPIPIGKIANDTKTTAPKLSINTPANKRTTTATKAYSKYRLPQTTNDQPFSSTKCT